MDKYSMLYRLLFNAITNAVDQLDEQNYGKAKDILKQAQQNAEDIYIQEGE